MPTTPHQASRRIRTVVSHMANGNTNKTDSSSNQAPNGPNRCGSCVHRNNCSQMMDIEDMEVACPSQRNVTPRIVADRMIRGFDERLPEYGLPGDYFYDKHIYQADLESIYHREWIFAGHDIELPSPGSYLTLNVGDYPLVVLRGKDGVIRAFHNVCRHRGLKLCDEHHGRIEGRNLVCQYHQWSYDPNDGSLRTARDMPEEFDASQYGLVRVHLESVNSYLFVCVAPNPPSFEPLQHMLGSYAAPYELNNSKVAYQSRIIEKGNWKLVWENNRECYHCAVNHPELVQSFPAAPVQSGEYPYGDLADELGLPSKFAVTDDYQIRAMRHLFVKKSTSMTKDGKPAIETDKRLGALPSEGDIGNVCFYHYPSTWNHWMADHAVTFRVLPISPTETEVVTTWLVPGDAVEGVDYDVKRLTETWEATNRQDQMLVERVQLGVMSPAFRPGPYSVMHEKGVIEFVEWYAKISKERLMEAGGRL